MPHQPRLRRGVMCGGCRRPDDFGAGLVPYVAWQWDHNRGGSSPTWAWALGLRADVLPAPHPCRSPLPSRPERLFVLPRAVPEAWLSSRCRRVAAGSRSSRWRRLSRRHAPRCGLTTPPAVFTRLLGPIATVITARDRLGPVHRLAARTLATLRARVPAEAEQAARVKQARTADVAASHGKCMTSWRTASLSSRCMPER